MIIKNLKNYISLSIASFLSFFVIQEVISEDKTFFINNINWKVVDQEKYADKILWKKITEKEIPVLEKSISNKKKLHFLDKLNLSKPDDKNQIYFRNFIPTNNFLNEGYFSHELEQISSFGGGDAKGTGNQNYSYRINYGLTNESVLSLILSEADDPYFFQILNQPKYKNFWRNYALTYNKKIFNKINNNFDISFNSSLELWEIETFYKKINNNISYDEGSRIVGSIGMGITKEIDNFLLSFSPKISFLPNEFGSSNRKNNFYGHNYSLGFGLGLDTIKGTKLFGTYSFLLGDSRNTHDSLLNFSKSNIYSYGINWDPNAILGFEIGVSNSFGGTPATSLLTIPSANIPLYTFKFKFTPNYRDTPKKPFVPDRDFLLHSGLTVNNALIPRRGTNEFWFASDNSKSIYSFYGYSISNIFQIELANLAVFKDVNMINNTNNPLRDNYFNDGNFNNRFGGTLNLFDPNKGDLYWMSLRTTIGRNQQSVQGYLFTEILNTFPLNEKISINLNPKYAWSGIKSTGGAGIGLTYNLKPKLYFMPEMNFNFRNNQENNNSLVIRYLLSENRSIDFYYTNALGVQDMSQLFKSQKSRFGAKFNIYF